MPITDKNVQTIRALANAHLKGAGATVGIAHDVLELLADRERMIAEVRAEADALLDESQAGACRIREAGVMQRCVARLRMIAGVADQCDDGIEVEDTPLGKEPE